MAQNLLVKKLQIFKELEVLAQKIIERPKYTTVGKTTFLTENMGAIAQGDAKFIKAVVFNSNPLIQVNFSADEKGNVLKLSVESDFAEGLSQFESVLNQSIDYKKFNKSKEQFALLHAIYTELNDVIAYSFDQSGIFVSSDELTQYIDTFISYLTPCITALKSKMDFAEKKAILRICNDHLALAMLIKERTTKAEYSKF